MQVILQERIRRLGNVGDVVSVKPGFARNYLVPYGKAVSATKANKAEFEKRRAEFEKAAEAVLETAKKRAKELASLEVKLVRKASEDGRLFGAIGWHEVLEAIQAHDKTLTKRDLLMPETHIRATGEYTFKIELHSDVVIDAKLVVEAL
mgnify:CR=1 FL=1|jgi:large subunit ribosomal protein L9